jgi:hypothetical protein
MFQVYLHTWLPAAPISIFFIRLEADVGKLVFGMSKIDGEGSKPGSAGNAEEQVGDVSTSTMLLCKIMLNLVSLCFPL